MRAKGEQQNSRSTGQREKLASRVKEEERDPKLLLSKVFSHGRGKVIWKMNYVDRWPRGVWRIVEGPSCRVASRQSKCRWVAPHLATLRTSRDRGWAPAAPEADMWRGAEFLLQQTMVRCTFKISGITIVLSMLLPLWRVVRPFLLFPTTHCLSSASFLLSKAHWGYLPVSA